MDTQKAIQIFDDLPKTHYFLYKGKKYPFNFDLFKISSKYFSSNQEEFLNSPIINLIDESFANSLNFTEESIQSFIKYSQREQILLTKENAVTLNYLAKKYEVNLLIQATESYIEEYQNDLALQILLTYQNDESFTTESFENIISNHFESYIKNDELLSLNFSILYRIFSKFLKKRDKTFQLTNEIDDFLFNCLSKYGRESSCLFSLIDVGELTSEKVEILLTTFSDVFDFHFINSSILKTIYETQNDALKKEEQRKIEQEKFKKKYEDDFKSLRDEIQKMKNDQKNQLDAQKQKEEENLREIREQFDKFKEELKELSESQAQNMNEMKKQLQIKDDEIQKMKNDQKNLLDAQKQKEEENLSEIKEQINNLKELNESHTQNINEMKIQLQKKEIEICLFKEILNFNLPELKQFNSKNVYTQEIIFEVMKNTNSNNNEKIEKIKNLLTFLSRFNEKSNGIFLFSNSNEIIDCDFSKIGIHNQMIEILYDQNELKSPVFLQNIENFSEFYFDIKYPSDKFQNIYQQVLEIKQSNKDKVKISIFITGIEETDQYFRNNTEINHVTLDTCIKEIKSSEKDEGSFEGCSSLENIMIPSTVKLIGKNSFKNCSSLASINIPSLDKKIEHDDFKGCNSLTRILVPSMTSSIPTANIDDYEIDKVITDNYNIILKGINKKTKEKVVIKTFNDKTFTRKYNFTVGSNISQIDLPGLTKIKSFRFPLTNEEKKNVKLLNYKTKTGKTYDLTGYIAIYDYIKNGNIYEITNKYLESKGKENDKMNPTIRSKIIYGVAATMKKLHEKKIIHRNLTNLNIFLDDNLDPKIGSFSLAISIDNPFIHETYVGTPCYCAPEMISENDEENNFPIDVFSYSIVLYILFSPPINFQMIKNCHTRKQYFKEILNGNRPERPDNIPDHYWSLIERCWQHDPSKRPTFEEITNILKDDKYALEEFDMKTDLEILHEYQNRMDKC